MYNDWMQKIDNFFIGEMHIWSIPVLRVVLGIVFLWFGALKVFGVSPVAELVRTSYSFFPAHSFLIFLGVWEIVIGLGLIFKIALRVTLFLLWLQMAGTIIATLLAPSLFFNQNIFLLTTAGEFVVKNLVLIASGLVIGGYEVKNREG